MADGVLVMRNVVNISNDQMNLDVIKFNPLTRARGAGVHSEITRLNLMQTPLMRFFFAARGDCGSLRSRGGVSVKTLVWIAHLFRRVLSITRYQ